MARRLVLQKVPGALLAKRHEKATWQGIVRHSRSDFSGKAAVWRTRDTGTAPAPRPVGELVASSRPRRVPRRTDAHFHATSVWES